MEKVDKVEKVDHLHFYFLEKDRRQKLQVKKLKGLAPILTRGLHVTKSCASVENVALHTTIYARLKLVMRTFRADAHDVLKSPFTNQTSYALHDCKFRLLGNLLLKQ